MCKFLCQLASRVNYFGRQYFSRTHQHYYRTPGALAVDMYLSVEEININISYLEVNGESYKTR